MENIETPDHCGSDIGSANPVAKSVNYGNVIEHTVHSWPMLLCFVVLLPRTRITSTQKEEMCMGNMSSCEMEYKWLWHF